VIMKALVGGGTKRKIRMTATIPGRIQPATCRTRRSAPPDAACFFAAVRGWARRGLEVVVLRAMLELVNLK